MYPDRELSRLAARKAALRHDIAGHRARWAEAAARVTRPLAWLDRMTAFCRRLAPLLGLLTLLPSRGGGPRRTTFFTRLLGRATAALFSKKNPPGRG